MAEPTDSTPAPEALRLENARLRQRLAQTEEELRALRREHRSFTERYVSLERSAAHLSNLHVASQRLHQIADRRGLVEVIEEIVPALLGSEQLALFETEGAALVLVAATGVDAGLLERIPLGEGRIGGTVLRGETFVAAAGEDGVRACVPLRLGDRPVGAIAIFGLLPQKEGFEARDLELLELLGAQAARALWCTRGSARRA